MLEPWLRESAGPVIRYRTAVELAPSAPGPGSPGAGLGADIAALQSALLADPTVRRWFDNLRSYDAVLVAEDALHDPGQAHADGVVGGLLAFNDLVGRAADLEEDVPVRGRVVAGASLETDAGDVGQAPESREAA